MNWPPYFPDLNPIEHVRYHLKKLVLQKYPDLEGMGMGEEAIKALENALVDCWDVLPNSLFVEVGLNGMLSTKRKYKVEERGWGAAGYRSGTFIDNSHRWSVLCLNLFKAEGLANIYDKNISTAYHQTRKLLSFDLLQAVDWTE